MSQAVANINQLTHFLANASTYVVTGTGVTAPVFGTSNREQENSIGSKIGTTTIDISIRNIISDCVIEYVVFKRERQPAVPIKGTGLPSDTDCNTLGLQMAYRTEMPGRILQFGMFGVAPEQPRVKKLTINWSKYKLGVMHTGDFYGVTVFPRGSNVSVDIQTRYKEIL